MAESVPGIDFADLPAPNDGILVWQPVRLAEDARREIRCCGAARTTHTNGLTRTAS
jgi:hypothetical protein